MLNNAMLLGSKNRYKIGNGLFFDSINDYIQTNLTLNNAKEYTFNFIFEFKDFSKYSPFLGNGDALSWGIFLRYDPTNNKIWFSVTKNGISYFLDINANNTDILCHITAILKSNRLELYKNGILEGFLNIPTGILRSNNLIKIGNFINVIYFNGCIYDAKIFDKALTQEEVTKLYNMEIPTTTKNNLIIDMPFEQLNKVGSNVFTPELVAGNNGQLIGYPTGAKGIVDIAGNDIQLVP